MASNYIHSGAVVDESATIGHFVVIENDVVIGPHCTIGHHAVIKSGTRIGAAVQIGNHSILGQQPAKSANSAVTKDSAHNGPLVADRVRIGSHSIIYAGCTLAEDVYVADLATIREEVVVGEKTIVGRGVAIENSCSIGAYCKLESNAYITAYSTIGDHVFVAPGVLTSNDNFLGRTEERFKHFKGATLESGSRLGVGSIVLPGVELPEEGVLAAGALLTKNGKEAAVHVGIPAKPIRPVPPEQLLPKKP